MTAGRAGTLRGAVQICQLRFVICHERPPSGELLEQGQIIRAMVKEEVHGDDGCLVESLSGLKGKPDRGTNNCAATNIPNQFVTKIVVLHLGDPVLLNYSEIGTRSFRV
jgi:hypothetical protein